MVMIDVYQKSKLDHSEWPILMSYSFPYCLIKLRAHQPAGLEFVAF